LRRTAKTKNLGKKAGYFFIHQSGMPKVCYEFKSYGRFRIDLKSWHRAKKKKRTLFTEYQHCDEPRD